MNVIAASADYLGVACFVGYHIGNLHMMLQTVEQSPDMTLSPAKVPRVISTEMQDFQRIFPLAECNESDSSAMSMHLRMIGENTVRAEIDAAVARMDMHDNQG